MFGGFRYFLEGRVGIGRTHYFDVNQSLCEGSLPAPDTSIVSLNRSRK